MEKWNYRPATILPPWYTPLTYEEFATQYHISEPIPPRPTRREVLEKALELFIDICDDDGGWICRPTERDIKIMREIAEKELKAL